MENKKNINLYDKETVQSKNIRRQYRRNIIKYIGKQINNINVEKNISLSELCKECNVSEKYIKWWMAGKGKFYLDMLCRICIKYDKQCVISIEDTK